MLNAMLSLKCDFEALRYTFLNASKKILDECEHESFFENLFDHIFNNKQMPLNTLLLPQSKIIYQIYQLGNG